MGTAHFLHLNVNALLSSTTATATTAATTTTAFHGYVNQSLLCLYRDLPALLLLYMKRITSGQQLAHCSA
jgi:hypothetical protein